MCWKLLDYGIKLVYLPNMNYRKYLYRNLHGLVDKAKDHLKNTGENLTIGFSAALKKHDVLMAKVEKLYADARKGGYDIANTPRWSETVNKAENFRREAEKLLTDNVRPYSGKQSVSVHVLVGYCPQTIPYYQKMVEELQKTFPEAETRDIELGKVSKSSCVQGFTAIMWWAGEVELEQDCCDEERFVLPKSRIGGKDFYISEQQDYYL